MSVLSFPPKPQKVVGFLLRNFVEKLFLLVSDHVIDSWCLKDLNK